MESKRIYLCGPMRKIKQLNWPSFDVAQAKLESIGYKVFSPAQSDREKGIDPNNTNITPEIISECAKRDLAAIFESDWIITLPGCSESIGASAEIAVAKWLQKPVYPLSEILPVMED